MGLTRRTLPGSATRAARMTWGSAEPAEPRPDFEKQWAPPIRRRPPAPVRRYPHPPPRRRPRVLKLEPSRLNSRLITVTRTTPDLEAPCHSASPYGRETANRSFPARPGTRTTGEP